MAAIRKFLTDEQWAKIAPLLPSERPGFNGGRPRVSNRELLEGILWILRTGTRWGKICPSNIQALLPAGVASSAGGKRAVAENLAHLPVATGRRRGLGLAGSLHRRQLRTGEKGGSEVEERYRHRWKIERTFAWLGNFRRLVIRYERLFGLLPSCLYHHRLEAVLK